MCPIVVVCRLTSTSQRETLPLSLPFPNPPSLSPPALVSNSFSFSTTLSRSPSSPAAAVVFGEPKMNWKYSFVCSLPTCLGSAISRSRSDTTNQSHLSAMEAQRVPHEETFICLLRNPTAHRRRNHRQRQGTFFSLILTVAPNAKPVHLRHLFVVVDKSPWPMARLPFVRRERKYACQVVLARGAPGRGRGRYTHTHLSLDNHMARLWLVFAHAIHTALTWGRCGSGGGSGQLASRA